MSWKQWLDRGEVKPHQTSKLELDNMRALIRRDLADAAIRELSEDRRFAPSYNAALQSAVLAIAWLQHGIGRQLAGAPPNSPEEWTVAVLRDPGRSDVLFQVAVEVMVGGHLVLFAALL